MTNQNNGRLHFTGYWLALFYVTLKLLSVTPHGKHPGISEARSWPGWVGKGEKAAVKKLKGLWGKDALHRVEAVADFVLGLSVCSRSVWLWA